MPLELDDREVVHLECSRCGRAYDRVVIFAKRDRDAYAVVSASCHGHDDRVVWLDVTLGSWIEPYSDHVTMSCRASAAGASIVDALVASRGDADYLGRRLPREVALTHPRLREMWELVDAVLTTVPEVAAQVYDERRA